MSVIPTQCEGNMEFDIACRRRRCAARVVLAVAGGLLLGAAFATRDAAAGKHIVHQKRALSSWVKDVGHRDEEKAWEAVLSLGLARYLVGAAEQAVPALRAALDDPRERVRNTAILSLGRYGPLAREALPRIRELAREELGEVTAATAILLIADEQAEGADLFVSLFRKDAESYRLYGGPLSLLVTINGGCEAGLRGAFLAEWTAGFLKRRVPLEPADVSRAARELGPAAKSLLFYLQDELLATDLWQRYGAADALLAIPEADPSHVAKAIGKLRSLPIRDYGFEDIARTMARMPHEAGDDALELLQKCAKAPSRRTRAWALAGLARFAPDAAKLVPKLQKELKHRHVDCRIAGATGLLALGPASAPARKSLTTALGDADWRVRWRAAALLLLLGPTSPEIEEELARVLDGPDDFERVRALREITRIGPKSAFLSSRIQRWAEVNCSYLSDPAEAALEALE